MTYNKPLPAVTPVNKEFWDAAKAGVLEVPRCPVCRKLFFPPRPLCPFCLQEPIEWVKVSGKGKVYSYTVVHRASSPGFQREAPYVFAIVELQEGPRITSNVINCRPSAVRVGMPVQVVFQRATDDITLPKFAPS